jgi:hypothetical protein
MSGSILKTLLKSARRRLCFVLPRNKGEERAFCVPEGCGREREFTMDDMLGYDSASDVREKETGTKAKASVKCARYSGGDAILSDNKCCTAAEPAEPHAPVVASCQLHTLPALVLRKTREGGGDRCRIGTKHIPSQLAAMGAGRRAKI